MRKFQTSFILLSSLALIGACGDDDGNGNPTPDAAAQPDGGGGADAPAQADAAAATFTLTYTSSGLGNGSMQEVHNGSTLYLELYDDAVPATPVASQNVVLDDQVELSVVFQDALVEGNSYTLFYYADLNDNAMCDGPLGQGNNDHGWSDAFANVTADVTANRAHDATFDGDCTRHP